MAFAASHVQVYYFVPLFVQGLLLCRVRRRSGSIWGAVAVHFVNDFLAWAVAVALR